jgi:ferredoxin
VTVAPGMRVTVDRDRCTGSGSCVFASPGVFTQSDHDGLVELLQDEPGADIRSTVRDAAAACPVGAITLSPH